MAYKWVYGYYKHVTDHMETTFTERFGKEAADSESKFLQDADDCRVATLKSGDKNVALVTYIPPEQEDGECVNVRGIDFFEHPVGESPVATNEDYIEILQHLADVARDNGKTSVDFQHYSMESHWFGIFNDILPVVGIPESWDGNARVQRRATYENIDRNIDKHLKESRREKKERESANEGEPDAKRQCQLSPPAAVVNASPVAFTQSQNPVHQGMRYYHHGPYYQGQQQHPYPATGYAQNYQQYQSPYGDNMIRPQQPVSYSPPPHYNCAPGTAPPSQVPFQNYYYPGNGSAQFHPHQHVGGTPTVAIAKQTASRVHGGQRKQNFVPAPSPVVNNVTAQLLAPSDVDGTTGGVNVPVVDTLKTLASGQAQHMVDDVDVVSVDSRQYGATRSYERNAQRRGPENAPWRNRIKSSTDDKTLVCYDISPYGVERVAQGKKTAMVWFDNRTVPIVDEGVLFNIRNKKRNNHVLCRVVSVVSGGIDDIGRIVTAIGASNIDSKRNEEQCSSYYRTLMKRIPPRKDGEPTMAYGIVFQVVDKE
jgi:hypothetical protein